MKTVDPGEETGTLNARTGVRQLYKICLATNYADDFMIWLSLDDGLDSIEAGDIPWTYEGLTAENTDEIVRAEAKGFRDAFGREVVR